MAGVAWACLDGGWVLRERRSEGRRLLSVAATRRGGIVRGYSYSTVHTIRGVVGGATYTLRGGLSSCTTVDGDESAMSSALHLPTTLTYSTAAMEGEYARLS